MAILPQNIVLQTGDGPVNLISGQFKKQGVNRCVQFEINTTPLGDLRCYFSLLVKARAVRTVASHSSCGTWE